MDVRVAHKLAATGMSGNTAITEAIHHVESLPRRLDSSPAKYMISRAEQDKLTPFGVYRDYRTMYNTLYREIPAQECTIMVGDEAVSCSFRTMIMLKTLVLCGACKAADRAKACKELFGAVLSRRQGTTLKEKDYVQALRDTGDYYKDEIVRAILDSVFTDSEQIDISISSAVKNVDVPTVREKMECTSVEEYEKEIVRIYKEACKNPEFKVIKSKGKTYNAIMYVLSDYFSK